MKLHYKTDKGVEVMEISVEDFLSMSLDNLSSLEIVKVKTSDKEEDIIQEQTDLLTNKYTKLQEQYGYEDKTKIKNVFFKRTNEVEEYISIYKKLDTFEKYQDHETKLVNTLASNHAIEQESLQNSSNEKITEIKKLHNERLSLLNEKQSQIEKHLYNQTNKKSELEIAIAEKKNQLNNYTEQANNEQKVIEPENLTQEYMKAIHKNLDESIGNIEGRVTGINHKLWVTNGAPFDQQGNPMTTFDDNGKVVGTVHHRGFPDMDCSGMYGVNYCTMSVVSCINGVDKDCGVDILNTESFNIQEDNNIMTVAPYASGWTNKNGRTVGESLSHRPDSLMCAFGTTGYVSGATVDENQLCKRADGTLAIDRRNPNNGQTEKIGTKAIQFHNVSLKDVYEQGTLLTDEKTGEKYYSYTYENNSQTEHVYLKDGDVICVNTPRGATNTSSGYHTIMINIDQDEKGTMTFTAGNGDHVRDPIENLGGMYTSSMAAFHTSEFARDKISSFDEQNRIQMAKGLGLLETDTTQEKAKLDDEIKNLNQQITDINADIVQTTANLSVCKNEISSENNKFQLNIETLESEQKNNEAALSSKQNEEKSSLKESLNNAAHRVFSGENLEEVVNDITPVIPKETKANSSSDELKGAIKEDYSKYQQSVEDMSRYNSGEHVNSSATNTQQKAFDNTGNIIRSNTMRDR